MSEWTSRVEGRTLSEIEDLAKEQVNLFFGRDVNFVLDIHPSLDITGAGDSPPVYIYEATVTVPFGPAR